jgi:alpha-tubulin suppressor-like RCC1 family protein
MMPLPAFRKADSIELFQSSWKERLTSMKIALVLFVGLSTIVPIQASAQDSGFRSIAAGVAHTCVLNAEGKAYCWGSNGRGQLGNHTTIDSTKPFPVDTTVKFSSITAGYWTTCGITKNDGSAYCWGDNTFGQLGTPELTENCGTMPCATSPKPISSLLKFSKIATERTGTCGLTESGDIYCWGDNGSGQLGQGDLLGPPDGVTCAARPCSKVPIAVKAPADLKGEFKFSSISKGEGTTCAVAVDGKLFCWGDGQTGKLGNGTTTAEQMRPVQAKGKLRFATTANGAYAVCGVTTDRAVYCWGGDQEFALGTDTPPEHCYTPGLLNFACSTKPNLVNGLKLRPEGGSIGFTTTTVCGIDPKGRAYCWGAGSNGQLGDGISTTRRRLINLSANSRVPVAVSGKQRFREIAVGSSHACGISEDRKTIYCWGGSFGNVPQAIQWDGGTAGDAKDGMVP